MERLEFRGMYPEDWQRHPGDFGLLLPSLRELTFHSTQDFTVYWPDIVLPSTLTSLTRLQSLTISHCSGLSRLPEGFGNLRALQTLVLRNLSLSNLPDSILHPSALETLVLHTLPLSRLSDSICQLTSLKTLVMFHLPLSFLPNTVCQLTSLETFILIDCNGNTQGTIQLPETFCFLTALQTLCVARMPQLRLPEDIGKLFKLQTVFLDGLLQQPRLPSTFTQLSSLTRLELSGCMIQVLPDNLGDLTNLQELHICSCPALLYLPETLTRLSSLDTLVVEGCRRLDSFPKSLESLRKLKWLESIRGKGQGIVDLPATSLRSKLGKLVVASPVKACPRIWWEKNAWPTW
ncbi:unnamed protein product [Closterium sp. NIES-53]